MLLYPYNHLCLNAPTSDYSFDAFEGFWRWKYGNNRLKWQNKIDSRLRNQSAYDGANQGQHG